MKKQLLKIAAGALVLASVPAFAQTPVDNAKIDVFLSASRNMQKAINNNEQIIRELGLNAGKLEVMMPDEQFQAICTAISRRHPQGSDTAKADKLADAEKVFGTENASEIIPIVGNPEMIENTRRQFRDAYDVFAGYHTTQEKAAELSDWGWGESYGVFINPNIGTLGIGIDAGYQFNKHFKIRAHYGSGKISHSGTFEDAPYSASFKNNNNYGVFLDWHPRGSQFHITGGLLRMDPRFKLTATYQAESGPSIASPSIPAGYGTQYRVTSHFDIDGKWKNDIQPYLGIGWSSDGGNARTLYFSIDIGIAYLGDGNYNKNPQDLAAGNPMLEKWNSETGRWENIASPNNPNMTQDLAAASTLIKLDTNIRDGLDKIAGFLNDMQVYPVLQFGFGIRF